MFITLIKLFTGLDLFGVNMHLFIKKKQNFKSFFGAVISLSLILIILFSFLSKITRMSHLDNISVISSTISNPSKFFLDNNMSYLYTVDENLWFPYFGVIGHTNDGKIYNYLDLQKYVVQKFYYSDIKGVTSEIEYEPLLKAKQDKFLLESDEIIERDKGLINNYAIVPKKSLIMGKYADLKRQGVISPSFSYVVVKCVNSTENNNSCASREEIDKFIKESIQVQVANPMTFYDFNNVTNIRKRTYENENYFLDPALKKIVLNKLKPSELIMDYGTFVEEDYHLIATDIFTESTQKDIYLNTNENEVVLLDYRFSFSQIQQAYRIKNNNKLLFLFESLGGGINILVIIAQILCSLYNSHVLKLKLETYIYRKEAITK